MNLADVSINTAVRFELPWFVCLAGGWGEPEQLERAVGQRIDIEPELAPWADRLQTQVLSVADDFRREGATVGALRFQHDPVFGLVTAYCSATLVPLDGPLDGPAMLERLRDDLTGSRPADASLPEIEEVDLGGRPSLRVAVTRLAPEVESGEGRPAFIVLEHWTPVAEVPGHVVRLAAMTSRLAFAGELTAEFDAIAATLHITVGSDGRGDV
jgi:hypothetical protein